MPMFAKRHYEAIALVLQRTQPTDKSELGYEVWQNVRNELAHMLASDNRLFKCHRFERACEPGANVRARS